MADLQIIGGRILTAEDVFKMNEEEVRTRKKGMYCNDKLANLLTELLDAQKTYLKTPSGTAKQQAKVFAVQMEDQARVVFHGLAAGMPYDGHECDADFFAFFSRFWSAQQQAFASMRTGGYDPALIGESKRLEKELREFLKSRENEKSNIVSPTLF